MTTALLVDDNEENLYFLQALLTGHGYQVRLAHEGAEALAAAHRNPPDLVIADILMPGMDGFRLCRHWHEDPTLRQIPFVFYTATYTEPKDEQLALSLGAARFIIKPKEPDEFMALVTEVLDDHRGRTLKGPTAPPPSDEHYLRQYNAVLIHKLEAKLTELDAKDALNRAVLDSMAAPIAAVGPRGEVLAVNHAWARLAARDGHAAALRLAPGDDALAAAPAGADGDNLRRLQAGLRDVLEDRSPSREVELSSGAGASAQYLTVRIERARSAGVGAVIACVDVTEIKRAEQTTRESSARKDEFLAMLGHELRNPLGAIKTATDVLRRVELRDPRAARAADVIGRQAANLKRIVDDLLDVARIARGSMLMERGPTDLVDVVGASVQAARDRFDSGGIALNLSLPREPAWVMGDTARLGQLMSNLLDNAQKFTDRGGRVDVGVEVDRAHHQALLRVADTGAGMTPETLARVFAPFEQAPQSTARTRGGLGLGLALVRGIVALHGGEVQAESAGLGRGTTFTVRLPLTDAVGGGERPVAPTGAAGARVLVIEDNHDAADTLRSLLEVEGASVAVAYDGVSGLALAREAAPETIICDLGLPGALDGCDVARALRAEPAFHATELVALTGYGQAEDVRRARDAGFDLHLTKPADAAELLAAVTLGHERARGGAR